MQLEHIWKEIVDHLNDVTFVSTDQWLPWQIERAQKVVLHGPNGTVRHFRQVPLEFNRIR